jgi:hypothetical protein
MGFQSTSTCLVAFLLVIVMSQDSAVPPACLDATAPHPPDLDCPINTPGFAGVPGVISQSTVRSCKLFDQGLDCGENGNVTIFDIGISPGTGSTTRYRLRVLTQASLADLAADPDGVKCSGSGDTLSCAIVKDLTLVITTTPIVVGYSLRDITLDVPFAYAAFHSNNYKHWPHDAKRQCSAGDNPQQKIGESSNVKGNIRDDGVRFEEPCHFSNGADDSSSGATHTVDPFPQVVRCGSDADDTTYNWPFSDSFRHIECDMPLPVIGDDTVANFGMVKPSGKSIYFFDRKYDRDGKWEVDDDDSDKSPRQCLEKFARQKNNSPCRQWYGNYWYLGYEPKNRLQWDTTSSDARIFTAPVRPVIVGCGAYLQFPGLLPRTDGYKGPQNPVKSYHDLHDGGRYKHPFGPDDDDQSLCDASIVDTDSDDNSVTVVGCRPAAVGRCSNVVGAQCDCPGLVCPSCNDDRTGLFVQGSFSFGSTFNGKTHETAESMGLLGPMCRVYEIATAPKPIFSATATLYDNQNNVVDSVTVSNSGQCDSEQTIAPIVGQASVGKSVLLSLVNIDTTTGRVADNVGGYIVICNQSATQSGKPPLVFMGKGECGRENPWNDIIDKWNREHPLSSPKGGGFVPLPEYLQYANKGPNANGTWWYYVPTRKRAHYGTGCGQLGMKRAQYKDPDFARRICSDVRYTCVPGFKKGGYEADGIRHDWTLEDRMTDIIETGGARERNLRDLLDRHTPCVISAYFQEWNAIQSGTDACKDFIGAYESQGYLPPGWVDQAGLGKRQCTAPKWWLQGANLLYELPNTNNLYLRMTAAVTGTAMNVETSISSGIFVRQKATDVQCGVIRNGDGGAVVLFVKNTGDLPGDYLIRGSCTGGITILTAPVVFLASHEEASVTIKLSQSGAVINGTSCTFELSHPTYTYLVFDRVANLPCTVEFASGGRAPPDYANTDACIALGSCIIEDGEKSRTDSVTTFAWQWLVAAILFILGAALLSYYGISSGKKASIQRAESGRRLDVNQRKAAELKGALNNNRR